MSIEDVLNVVLPHCLGVVLRSLTVAQVDTSCFGNNDSMMQVFTVSGRLVAQLEEDELDYMVETGKVVRDLKRLLSTQVGCSSFQQRLFSDESRELEDDFALRSLSSVQLVILPLCAIHETMEEELLTSCLENNVVHVERLLQKAFDPNERGYLFVAATKGHLEVVRLLLEAGADKDAAERHRPLHFAALEGHLEVVRLLLEAGADKDAADTDGDTALHIAALGGRLEVVRLLLDAAAEKDAAARHGETALHFAAQEGHLEVVRLLLEAGADKDAATRNGATAVCLASKNCHLEVVRLLLEAGADKDAAMTV